MGSAISVTTGAPSNGGNKVCVKTYEIKHFCLNYNGTHFISVLSCL